MSISHRTNRLKLVSAPTVEQLQNGRFRLIFNARPLNPRESWYNANKNRIFAAFGTLQDAEMSIDGIGARTGAAYTDMRLVSARTIPDEESYLVQFTYETIGSSFVQVKDDTISFTESGLRRVQRESIAAAGTAFSQTVGTTTISHQINAETAVNCRLAAFEINDTDSSRTVVATYVEEGTLSRTEDFVGSQKAIVIEAIGPDPSTPDNYSLASKEESNFEGLQTNRFTFLKDGAVLSSTTEERQSGPNSTGKVRIQTVEVFNGTPASTIGGVKISEEQSNVGAIVTTKAVFATGLGEVSRSTETRNQGKLTITTVESLGSAGSGAGVEIEATTREENGFTLFRNVFALGQGEISRTEDFVGSQKSVVIESLGDTGVTPPGGNYVKAQEDVSDINNVIRKRATFLLKNAELSKQTDKLGALEVIVKEVFNPTTNVTESNFTEIKREDSNVGGIETQRVTFYKDNAIISKSTDKVGSQRSVVIEKFKQEPSTSDASLFGDGENYAIVRKEVQGKEGSEIYKYTFLEKDSVLSRRVEQKQNGILPEGQDRLTIEVVDVFDPEDDTALQYTTINATRFVSEEISEVDGIPTKRFTYVVANDTTGQTEVSKTTTSADPALPLGCKEITEVHVAKPIPAEPPNQGKLIRESVQNQDGYELHTRTYLEGSVTGTTTEYEDYIEVEIPGEVSLEQEQVSSGNVSGTIAIVKVQPKRIQRKKAKIKVEIIKVEQGGQIPDIGEIAYDLGKISCSVTATNLQRSIGPGSTVTIGAGTNSIMSDTGFVSDFKVQTSVTNYPGHFLTGDREKEGTIEYISSSQPVASGNIITREEETVARKTKLIGTGSDSSDKSTHYKETGVISRKVRPVLTDLQTATAKYYEVITTTIESA